MPDLQGLLDELAENEELTQLEDWQTAVTVLDQAKQFLETI